MLIFHFWERGRQDYSALSDRCQKIKYPYPQTWEYFLADHLI